MGTAAVAERVDTRVLGRLIAATYWNRLEPRPRSREIADVLAARVRDPLWMLTRQWQIGEFAAADAASPAYVQIRSRTGPVLGWRPAIGGGPMQQFVGPLEDVVETESVIADLATRIEFGQLFGRLLEAQGVNAARLPGILGAYRRDYPVQTAGVLDTDRGGTRLATLCSDRAIDGVRVAAAVGAPLPADADVTAEAGNVRAAIAALWVELQATLGSAGNVQAPAWRREQLEYRVEIAVRHPASGPLLLKAKPDRDAAFEWFTFDAFATGQTGIPAPPALAAGPPPPDSVSMVPTFVSFRGMPNHRWWDFERGATDFGAVTPDKRDVAKLVMMDFMLIHSNDYFLVSFQQRVGTACRIEAMYLHDVMGGITLIERADKDPAPAGRRWTCFSLATADQDGRPADFFFLPPTAGAHRMAGEPVEDVRFVRDEQANYVWAIEQCAEGGDGLPWIGNERSVAEIAKEPVLAPPVSAAPLFYQLQTFVPWHWFPMIPVSLNPLTGETALERGQMQRPGRRNPTPIGRLLDGVPYQVREEAVPRVGVRVVREAVRSRWLLGDTHLWVARRKLAGRGEGSSGLRYDVGKASQHPA
jgi:hypothetical protein